MPEDRAAGPDPSRRARAFWWVFLGSLMLQLAYSAVVPAFRGSDEFDHVYKADSVAHGQWFGTVDTPQGRGQLLEVSASVQQAAQARCRDFDYTEADDCRAVDRVSADRVRVSSAAALYNPAYYAVVGTVARPFDGEGALWAMRTATILLGSSLLGAAALVVSRWARTPWPGVAFVVACTPTLLYSASVVAPNGVGYAAAALWWAAAISLCRQPDRTGWAAFTVGAVVTLACHSTNPLWVPLMCLTLLVLRPPSAWLRELRDSVTARVAVGTVAVTGVACLGWARLVGTHAVPEYGIVAKSFPWDRLLGNEIAWHLQTIAAFPLRNEPAPVPVYVFWVAALAGLLVAGVAVADRRTRVAMSLLVAAWVVIPLVLTWQTYATMDYSWQGRYALPLVLGLPFLAGAALDERGLAARIVVVRAVVGVGAALHALSVGALGLQQSGSDLSTQLSEAVPGGWAVCALVALGGGIVLGRGALAHTVRPRVDADPSERAVVSARQTT